MSTLIEFFNNVTGLDVLNIGNSPINFLIVAFAFVIVYDVIHIVFGSLFDFTYRK